MRPLFLLPWLFILGVACQNSKETKKIEVSYDYELKSSDSIKKFCLDFETKYNAFYLYVFEDKERKRYLSFLNYSTNQILFYDLERCDFLFKIEIDQEGENGVYPISGYFIEDFDHIFLSSYGYAGLIRIDTIGKIRQKIPYGKTPNNYEILPSYVPSSHPFVPPVFIDDKVYITQRPLGDFYPKEQTPLSVSIDTVSFENESYPLYYDIFTQDQMQAAETRFSRLYQDDRFVYSFYIDERILVASRDHTQQERLAIKSKYITSIPTEKRPQDLNAGAKENLEVARYGELLYDKYRNVYYRFAYPATELDPSIHWGGRAVYGRKKFSIIILDHKFNIIGETLFPEGIYNSYVFFIAEDGLYISRDYQMNFDQLEDYMTFERIDLVKKKD